MIFVTVGTTDRQFNRLIKKIDELVGNKKIKEKVIAQIGFTEYEPKNMKILYKPVKTKGSEWFKFVDDIKIIEDLTRKADLVISHGGAGCISLALYYNKPLIIVPRLKKFGEHRNDHQVELARELESEGKCIAVTDINKLLDVIKNIKILHKQRKSSTGIDKTFKEIKKIVNSKKVCVACNPGGHFTETKPFLDLFKNIFFVTMKTNFTPTEFQYFKTYFVYEPHQIKYFLINIFQSLWIIFKEKPKVVFSTGAGLAITLAYFSKIFGAKIIYVESFAQVDEKSWTGKFIYPISDLFYVRWKKLEKKYGKKAKYISYLY